MNFYREEVSTVLNEVKSTVKGLTSDEAAKRLEQNGKNKLNQAPKDSLIKRFFAQLTDPMIIILLVAAGISALLSLLALFKVVEGESEFADVIIIIAVVLINAVLGVYQESKAEKAIEALQEMSAATTKTLRDGKVVAVKSEDLVVGDVIILEAGDSIPADCRIIECASMKIEEAALTGESVPVTKMLEVINGKKEDAVPLGDRKNMAYMGSTLVYGRGKAVVVATGMDTEMGKIADAIATAEDGETPLQKKLSQLSKILTFLVIGISIFIFGFQVVKNLVTGADIGFSIVLEFFMVAVSLAVAAIPEGLAAVVTIVLSMGVTTMSKKNAIIRKLTAVETLGCAQIICSDKTGTLTQNVMTVVDSFCEDEKNLATMMSLCTDVTVNSDGTVTGEPTEAALVNFALKLGLNKNDLSEKMPRIGEAPFDSGRKMMSTVHESGNGIVQFTKGAPDIVVGKCKFAQYEGKIVPMSEEIKEKIATENKRMADKALRVLACAMKKYPEVPASFEPDELEYDMVFVGLTGMIDPVRPEVKDAIDECRGAGITPIMITGDHKDTAVAIARELGIITDEKNAMTGADLEKLSEEEFDKVVENVFVYARVQPEHKTRIVNAWKKKGYVTAMTGDGVNDAPSIKSADIGVGMGITGTDVTKNVADMVLADDNFATIVSAVGEGRRIYDNIRKAIQFLLGSNLSEVLSIFFATLLGFTILEAPHLLWINLVTDCFPALALGVEKPESDIMRRKPRSAKAGVFSGGLGIDVLYQGALVTVLTLVAYFFGVNWGLPSAEWLFTNISLADPILHDRALTGTTMAFLTMSMCEIFHSLNLRSQRGSVIKMMAKGSFNIPLFGSMLAALVMTTAVIEIDFLAKAFDFVKLDLAHYGVAMGLAVCIIPIVEIVKAIQRAATKNK
ncbi:MAG: cation-translocating P-type ATPase [Clostridia bacterium]|nr:cation-translocating P-type ATPase [Clostridia bacterium]